MKRVVYYIYVYGPESDYEEELIHRHEYKSLREAERWASQNIPFCIGYKIYKMEQVLEKKPKSPNYVS